MQVERERQVIRERLAQVDEWKRRRDEVEAELARVWVDGGDALDAPEYVGVEEKEVEEEEALSEGEVVEGVVEESKVEENVEEQAEEGDEEFEAPELGGEKFEEETGESGDEKFEESVEELAKSEKGV